MKIVIDTTISPEGLTSNAYLDKRYKDVQTDYTLGVNEAWATGTEGLKEMYHLMKIDYKRYRAGLQVLGAVDDTTFDAYSDAIKKEITRENATSFPRVIDILTQEGADEATAEFDKKSVKTREKRFRQIKAVLLNNIEMVDAFTILNQVKAWAGAGSYNLQEEYINHGVEGYTSTDPILGFYDFIDGTDETGLDAYGRVWNYFSATGILPGIRHQTLTFRTSSTLNAGTLADQMLNILKYGKKNP